MDRSIIKLLPPRLQSDRISWSGELLCAGSQPARVDFQFTCPQPEAFVPRVRPFLLAFLPAAMRAGRALQLEQPIDGTTLDNLMEWQELMACWFPDQLKVVTLHAPIALEPDPVGGKGAVTAFSGGVDSCFTAFRHTRPESAPPHRRTRLCAGLMVHGFDIPEAQADVFASAFRRAEQVLRSLGLRLYQLRTNLRTLESRFGLSWEHQTHGIWLGAALSCLEAFFERALIPSTYPYNILRIPWASNPAGDVLLGSETRPYWHDGAAWSKLGKVRAMAEHHGIREGLRVCWEGGVLDRNCGRCFKCVATQVCYWLSGVPRPECFPEACGLEDVARTRLRTASNRALFRQMALEARRQGATPLARALGRAIARDTRRRLRERLRQVFRNPRRLWDQV
jgi:hypothetical protein